MFSLFQEFPTYTLSGVWGLGSVDVLASQAANQADSGFNQGTMGCNPNSVPMVFIVLSRDSWGL